MILLFQFYMESSYLFLVSNYLFLFSICHFDEVKLKTPEELEKLKTALLPLGFLCSKQSLQDSRLCLRIDFNFKLLNYSKRYGAEVELEAVFKGVKTAWLAKGYKARNSLL